MRRENDYHPDHQRHHSGTTGKPLLKQLYKKALSEIVVITVVVPW